MPLPAIKCAKAVAKGQAFLLGDKRLSKLLDKIAFGSYNDRIPSPKTKYDWLVTRESVVDEYLQDPLCGFSFTVNGFVTLFELLQRAHTPENMHKIPKELPVLLMAGEEDPVGDYGEGIKRIYQDYRNNLEMQNVTLKLYPGDRHEILNEKDRQQVYEDIYPWIMDRVREYQL